MLPREDHPRSQKVGEGERKEELRRCQEMGWRKKPKKGHKGERKQKCRLNKKKGCGRGNELKGRGGKERKKRQKRFTPGRRDGSLGTQNGDDFRSQYLRHKDNKAGHGPAGAITTSLRGQRPEDHGGLLPSSLAQGNEQRLIQQAVHPPLVFTYICITHIVCVHMCSHVHEQRERKSLA